MVPTVTVCTGEAVRLYDDFVSACPTALVQQAPEWRTVVAGDPRDEPVYFVARNDRGDAVGALPAFHFHGGFGDLMISVPQAGGYGGVVTAATGDGRDVIHRALLDALTAEARKRECLLATVATPPFFGDLASYRAALEPDFERENFYQFIDLAEWTTERAHGRAAKYVRRAEQARARHGLTVTFDDDTSHFEAWLALHETRMREIGVTPLPRAFLQAIRDHVIAAGKGVMGYVLADGALVAGCMFVGQGQVLDCFMLSGSAAGERLLATSALVVDALDWASRAGYRYFNWQSSSSRESGVYHFKAKWGSREGQHHYLTRITGDITALRRTPLPEIRAAYPWHYVMPFEQFTSPV